MLLQVARVILILLEVLVLFNLLIVVHELGHFRAKARPTSKIWRLVWEADLEKDHQRRAHSLGSLPFGGFVALPQLAPMDIIEGKADIDRTQLPPVRQRQDYCRHRRTVLQCVARIRHCLSDRVVGYPVSEADTTTTVGYVLPESPARRSFNPVTDF
jgi:regulator of sigma E protease